MLCLNSQDQENNSDSLDAYCGPLSETTTSGIPCLAIAAFSLCMMDNWTIQFKKSTVVVNCDNVVLTLS